MVCQRFERARMPILAVERIPDKWPDHAALVQHSASSDTVLCCGQRVQRYELSPVSGNTHVDSCDALMTAYKQ